MSSIFYKLVEITSIENDLSTVLQKSRPNFTIRITSVAFQYEVTDSTKLIFELFNVSMLPSAYSDWQLFSR